MEKLWWREDMFLKPLMFYIGGFLLSILFCSDSSFCSSIEEDPSSRIFFNPILPGSIRSIEDWTYDESGRVTSPQGEEIRLYNQPKLLRDVREHGLKAVQTLFRQSIVRVIKHEDGEIELKLSGRLRGGMQRSLPIIEKSMDKINRVVVPIIGGILGALGIQGTQEALNQQSTTTPKFDLMDHLNNSPTQTEQVQLPQTIQRKMPILVPRVKPMKQSQVTAPNIFIPQTKPIVHKPQTIQSNRQNAPVAPINTGATQFQARGTPQIMEAMHAQDIVEQKAEIEFGGDEALVKRLGDLEYDLSVARSEGQWGLVKRGEAKKKQIIQAAIKNSSTLPPRVNAIDKRMGELQKNREIRGYSRQNEKNEYRGLQNERAALIKKRNQHLQHKKNVSLDLNKTLDYFKGQKTGQYTGLTTLQEQKIISTAQAICLRTGQTPDSGPLKDAYKEVVLFPPLSNVINYFIGQGVPKYTNLSQSQGTQILDLAMDNCFNNNVRNPDSGPIKDAYKQVVYLTPVKHTLEWYGRNKIDGGAGIHYFKALGPKYEGRVISVAQELSYRFDLKPDSAVISCAYDSVMSEELTYVFNYHRNTTKAKQYRDLYPIQAQKVIQLGLTSMKNSGTSEPDTAPLSKAFNQIGNKGWNQNAVEILQTKTNPEVLHNTKGVQSVFNERNGLVYPLLNEEITSASDLLIRGYKPQEDHENLGLSFLQACGGCGEDILVELLGILTQAHAGYGLVAQGTCYALSRTVGAALTTMLGKELFSDSVLEKLDEGIYYDFGLIPGLGAVSDFFMGDLRKKIPLKELEKLENILTNVAPGDPNDLDPDSDDEEDSFDPETAKYEGADYHHINSKGAKSKAPTNPDKYLKGSIRFSKNSPHRINVDPETNEYIFYSRTQSGKYHGHVKSEWSGKNGFTNQQIRSLYKARKTDLRGDIK